MRAFPGPSAQRAEGRSSRSTYHHRVADPEDPKPKKKLTAGAWEEARALVWAHRKRLGIGLSLMVVNRLAGLVLPTTSKYLMDDVVGKQNWGLLPTLALAVGAMVRRSAAAVTLVIAIVVLPYFLAIIAALPDSVADWIVRLTPAAAFAVQQAVPAYPQVAAIYSPAGGYYPLPPWAGLAVLVAWAALALTAAIALLRRRDA